MTRKKEIRQQSRTLLILSLVLLVAVTAGVSYAFFNYTRFGATDNTITTGTITFVYDEKEAVGNGILIEDAFPMTDADGIRISGTNNVFDFKIMATTTGNSDISYEITARKDDVSDDIDESVKLYLTEVETNSETEAPLTIDNNVVKKYSELTQTTIPVDDGIVEKTIYKSTVQSGSRDYEKNFRLRMWIADDVNFSPDEDDNYPMNNKKFKVKVNVYANATVVKQGE